MSWRYRGRCTSLESAQGYCDRCNFLYSLNDLRWQYDYRGINQQNLRIKVCCICMDKPATFTKTIILPADPVPRMDPRPGDTPSQMGAVQISTWDQETGGYSDSMWDDSVSTWG